MLKEGKLPDSRMLGPFEALPFEPQLQEFKGMLHGYSRDESLILQSLSERLLNLGTTGCMASSVVYPVYGNYLHNHYIYIYIYIYIHYIPIIYPVYIYIYIPILQYTHTAKRNKLHTNRKIIHYIPTICVHTHYIH